MNGFFINLDRRMDRRRRFEDTCARAAIAVERFSAVDGRTVTLPSARGEGDRGIYASLLSHRGVLELARERRLPEVMVFEDDAVFPEWFASEVEHFMSLVPADWGLVYFGGHGWPRRWSHVRGPVLRGTNIQNIECYVARDTVYDRLAEALDTAAPIPSRWADEVLKDLQGEIPTYTLLNPPVRQALDHSDNYGRTGNYYDSRCDIPGSFTDIEGEEYLRQVRRFPCPVVAQLGAYKGRSASFVAELVHRRGGALFCIDRWDCEPKVWGDFEWWMNATGLRPCLDAIRKDTADAARFFADGCFDLVLHDGDQTDLGVRREITAWLPKLRPGGVVLVHDYANVHGAYPGVKRAVDELLGPPDRLVESLWTGTVNGPCR